MGELTASNARRKSATICVSDKTNLHYKMKQAEKYLQELINQNKTPCVSYHIFDAGNIIYQFKSGFANIGKEIKANDETTFHFFSSN